MLSEAMIAISLLHPTLPEATVRQYANSIDQQAIVAGVDPLSFVATIEHESRFNQFAVSYDSKDFGLMQVRAQYFKGKANWLFNPNVNIHAGANVIKASIDMCEKHLKRKPMMSEWMSCYMGACGSKASFCRPTKRSVLRERYHDCLIDAVYGDKDINACKPIYN